MAKEFDYVAAAVAASERVAGKKPAKDSPGLDPTASWLFGDAQFLFEKIRQFCGLPIANFIFKECIKRGNEMQADREKAQSKKEVRERAPLLELPTKAKQDAMNREEICRWWARFANTDQAYDERAHHLFRRYLAFGGQPEGFNPNLPPIKKKGARRRNAPKAAELPAMFDALKMKHPSFNKPRIAEIIAEQTGTIYAKSAGAIERAERKWRKKNRKV